jgi:uncharacterized protein (DUF2141 family)
MNWFFMMLMLGSSGLSPAVNSSSAADQTIGITEDVSLIIEIVGFESDEGRAVVSLMSEDEWTFPPSPDNASIRVEAEITDGAAHIEVSDLSSGSYIAFAYHDIDLDRRLDMGVERTGISGAEPQMQSMNHPPAFEDLCFDYSGELIVLRLTVREMQGPNMPSGPPPLEGGPGGGPGGGGFR